MQISEFLRPDNIVLDLDVPSKQRLLEELADRAAQALGLDAAHILTALTDREQLGSTGMGQGIAIPHAVLEGLDTPFCLLARLSQPVDYEAIDDAPVDIVFLLLNPAGSSSLALKALSCMARALREDEVVTFIRSSPNPRAIYNQIVAGHEV